MLLLWSVTNPDLFNLLKTAMFVSSLRGLHNNRLDTPQKIMRKMRNAHAVVDCLRQSLDSHFLKYLRAKIF